MGEGSARGDQRADIAGFEDGGGEHEPRNRHLLKLGKAKEQILPYSFQNKQSP